MAQCVQSCSVSQAQLEGLSIGMLGLSCNDVMVMRASTEQINVLYCTCIDSAALTEAPELSKASQCRHALECN